MIAAVLAYVATLIICKWVRMTATVLLAVVVGLMALVLGSMVLFD